PIYVLLRPKTALIERMPYNDAHNARRSGQVYNAMPVADGSQEYLVNKGVKAFPGVKADKKNRVVIPLVNEEGEVRTLQRISANGFKSLKKNGQKTGNFFCGWR
ncbi:DNA primase TraC4, partial [Candidatus Regiella insecticola 5.15]